MKKTMTLVFLMVSGVGLTLALILTPSCASHQPQPYSQRLSILQGVTSDSKTHFTVVVPKANSFSYKVISKSGTDEEITSAPVLAQRYSQPDSDWAVEKLAVSGLTTNQTYNLQVFNSANEVIDQRRFKTLPVNDDHVLFAVLSCTDDTYRNEQKVMWNKVWAQKPQIIFWIGDNVYADKHLGYKGPAKPADLWRRYVETRQSLLAFYQEDLIPVLATWDDHDYGANDGDRNYPDKEKSAQIFRVFNAQDRLPENMERGPGVSFAFFGFQQTFLFMDNRSFRSPKGSPPAEQTHWGDLQEKWMMQMLKQSQRPAWILNGDQFFGAYHNFESYEGQRPESFAKMKKLWAKNKFALGLISGDRHLAEVMKIPASEFGYETREITSSALHAKVFPNAWEKTPNPRQEFGVSGTMNFATIESTRRDLGMSAKVKIFTAQQEAPVYDKEIVIKK